jgi:hypothetical protein
VLFNYVNVLTSKKYWCILEKIGLNIVMGNVMNKSIRDQDIEVFGAIERSDGSYVHNDGDIFWYDEEGFNHREDGPAMIYANGKVAWYLNDIKYSFAEWCDNVNISDEVKMMLRLSYE